MTALLRGSQSCTTQLSLSRSDPLPSLAAHSVCERKGPHASLSFHFGLSLSVSVRSAPVILGPCFCSIRNLYLNHVTSDGSPPLRAGQVASLAKGMRRRQIPAGEARAKRTLPRLPRRPCPDRRSPRRAVRVASRKKLAMGMVAEREEGRRCRRQREAPRMARVVRAGDEGKIEEETQAYTESVRLQRVPVVAFCPLGRDIVSCCGILASASGSTVRA